MLPVRQWTVNLQHEDLVLCHMDLAPRNILILEDGDIGIVDWSTLSYYPSVFEFASLSYMKQIAPLNQRSTIDALRVAIQPSNADLEEDIRKLEVVQFMSNRYIF